MHCYSILVGILASLINVQNVKMRNPTLGLANFQSRTFATSKIKDANCVAINQSVITAKDAWQSEGQNTVDRFITTSKISQSSLNPPQKKHHAAYATEIATDTKMLCILLVAGLDTPLETELLQNETLRGLPRALLPVAGKPIIDVRSKANTYQLLFYLVTINIYQIYLCFCLGLCPKSPLKVPTVLYAFLKD